MRLKNIKVNEVSLVDKAANRKKFTFMKRDDTATSDVEDVVAVLETAQTAMQVVEALEGGSAPTMSDAEWDEAFLRWLDVASRVSMQLDKIERLERRVKKAVEDEGIIATLKANLKDAVDAQNFPTCKVRIIQAARNFAIYAGHRDSRERAIPEEKITEMRDLLTQATKAPIWGDSLRLARKALALVDEMENINEKATR